MRAAAVEAGRDPDAIAVTTMGATDLDSIKQFADRGVTRMVIPNMGGDAERWQSRLGAFSESVISKAS
jgi:hypothetical protein